MNPSEKNRLYDKYLAGDISHEEMHTLNQYALNDDFLFDAIEGASSFEDVNASAILDLKFRLSAKKKKVKPLYFWLSAAAGIAIIVFALTFIQTPQQEMMSDVVLQKTEAPVEISDAAAVESDEESFTDSDGASDDTNLSPVAPVASKSILSKAQADVSEREFAFADESKRLDQVQPSPTLSAPIPETEPTRLLAPVEDVAIMDVEEISQDKEKIIIEKKEVEASLSGAERKKAAKPEVAVLSRNDAKLRNEANGFTPSKKLANVEANGQGQDVSTSVNKEGAESEASDTFFSNEFEVDFQAIIIDDPIATNLLQKYISDSLEVGEQEGEFIVTLTIMDGKLDSEIKIIKSINRELDEDLLQLIESFEGWKGSGNKTIRFLFN